MRVFIGYKYTHTKNKKQLRRLLERLAKEVEIGNHETFLLHRDVLDWGKHHLSKWREAKSLLSKLLKADVVMMVVSDKCPSRGLSVENRLANLLGKKKLVLVKTGVNGKAYQSVNNTYFEYKDDKELVKFVGKYFAENRAE